MKSHWIKESFPYDGSQLRCQYAYLEHGVLGDSIVAWRGSCNISFENMADGEDLLSRSEIRGDEMVHFLVEVFDEKLSLGVALQRIFASLVRDVLEKMSPRIHLRRDGDDLYHGDKKLSISVAAKSPLSVVVHFAVNIVNSGTPVPTCALSDFDIQAEDFAEQAMGAFVREFKSLRDATYKVKPVLK